MKRALGAAILAAVLIFSGVAWGGGVGLTIGLIDQRLRDLGILSGSGTPAVPTLAQVLASGASGNSVSQTSLGDLTLASGKTLTTVGAGDLVSGDDLTVADDATISGDLAVTGALTAGSFSATVPMVVVERLSTQAVVTATGTYISYATETRDDLGISAVGAGANTKVCTFTAAAVWDCKVGAQWDANAVGYRSLGVELYSSGDALKWAAYSAFNPTATSGVYQSISDTFRVASGDYVKVAVYQTSGGNLDVGGVNPYTHVTLSRLGN